MCRSSLGTEDKVLAEFTFLPFYIHVTFFQCVVSIFFPRMSFRIVWEAKDLPRHVILFGCFTISISSTLFRKRQNSRYIAVHAEFLPLSFQRPIRGEIWVIIFSAPKQLQAKIRDF